jgi:hypothetical protein
MPELTCGGCAVTWTGSSRCHCSACHRTFGGVGGFDAHRVRDGCVDPQAKAMVRNPQGVWVYPVRNGWTPPGRAA